MALLRVYLIISVTQDNEKKPPLSTGEIIGVVIGGISALLAVPGVYFAFKEWSRRKRTETKESA
jgi:gas vesicle protein